MRQLLHLCSSVNSPTIFQLLSVIYLLRGPLILPFDIPKSGCFRRGKRKENNINSYYYASHPYQEAAVCIITIKHHQES